VDAGETDRDGGQESLRDVGDDNADEKDDGVEPEIAEQERDHEERDSEKEQTGALGHVTLSRDSPQEMGRDSEEDGDGGDDVDEVGDLAGDRRLDRLEAAGEDRYATHHRTVAGVDHHAATRT